MDETLDKLKIQLDLLDWPDVYLFKFIVPNESETVALLSALFDSDAEIVLHPSKTGKYISLSAKELMLDVDSIIEKYKKASLIKGIISL
ncbi:MAG: DUF493 domain-containing protein [Bacteroidota bacterium]